MAAIGTAVTLADLAKRLDANGKVDKISEILTQTNEILDDMMWVEGNLPTGHKTTIRTGLPAGTWRKLNYGVTQEKSETAQITDSCGMLESYSTVDKKLVTLNGNTDEFRFSEDRAFIQGLGQTLSTAIFYGNQSTNPEQITGFAPRYSSKTTTVSTSAQIIDAGGSTALTSIWLILWGPDTMHGIYPKGSKAGLQFENLGQVTVYDASNNPYEALRSHYTWDCGLTVRDWQYACRIANVATGSLSKNAAIGADVVDLMTQALDRVKDMNLGRPAFYCNRTIRSILRRQINNKGNNWVNFDTVAGKKVLMFGEVPVRLVDKLVNTETQVS